MKKTSKPVKVSRKNIKRTKQEHAINHDVVQPPVAQTPDDALPAQSAVAIAPEHALKEEAVLPAVSKMVDAALDDVAQSAASAPLDLSLSLWAQAETAAAAVDAGAGAGAAAGAGASTAAVATGTALSTGAIVAGVAAVGVAAAAGGGGSSTQTSVVSTDTTAPVVTFTAATDDVGSVTGALVSGATTDDTALVLSGTTEAGATVKVYNGATFLGDATVTGTNWTYTATVADGTTYQFNAKATDAAGNTSAATANFTVIGDTTAPTINLGTGLAAHSTTQTIDLTYNEALDPTNLPLASSFVVTTGGVANLVTSVSVVGFVMTLTLQDPFAPGAVTVTYTDAAGNNVNAIQDAAGNDAAGFSTVVIADGYIRGATVYIDTNGNGVVDPVVDYLAGSTDASGNLFIPAGAPTGTIMAVGGINIDTGVANTTVLKAPAGSTTINPLTTLVQAVVQASGGTTSAADAAATVATSLGLTGLGGQSLLNYDPISSGNVGAQKAAAQVATIAAMAESSSAGAGADVISNLVTLVNNAGATPVGLADASTISAILPAVVQADAAVQSAISDASTSIGNAVSISAISVAQSQALDTIAPNAPTGLSVAATTNDSTPAVRVNFNATATNGTAAVAGDTITLRENGAQAGTAVTLTAADIAAGFKLVDASSLPDGSHTLSAVLTDQAGNVSAVATGVVVNIDTQAPAAPVINTVATDDVINSSEQTAVVSGLAEANATVSLSIGGNTRTATANGSGSWSYTLQATDITAMGQGAETLSATATDAAGNASAAGTRAINVDTLAPTLTAAVTGADDNVTPTIGNVASGASTNDNTLTLSGTISGTPAGNDVVVIYDGAVRLGLATISGSTWSFNIPSLSNAVHSFTAKVEDAAGNSGSAGTAYAVTVNATVPTAAATITTVTDDVAAYTGNIASGGISNDSIPVLGGAVVGTLGADSVVIYDGATRLGAASVTGTNWSYTPSALSAGAHSFTAVVETNAGNQGAMSAAYGLTLDFTAPNAAVITPVAIDNVVNSAEIAAGIVVTGTAEAGSTVAVTWGALSHSATATGGVWSVTFASGEVPADNVSSTISATATDVAGNAGIAATRNVEIDSTGPVATIATVTGDNAINAAEATAGVTVTGTTEANAKVALSVGAGNIRSLTADGSGNWTYQLSATDIKAMGQGSETLSVTATDAAGNSGSAATQAITIDTAAPVLTAFSITDASDSGIEGDGRSNVGAPTISFTAEAGAILAIDSGDGAGYVDAGLATGSAQARTKPSPFVTDGIYAINLKATDAAGNITVRTASYTFDSSAPSAPTISGIADNVGSIQVNLADNARTDDTQLVISGTAEAYATVKVYNGATELGTAAANASGNWTYTTPTLSEATAYAFSAKATDVAGNAGIASVTTTVTIDTTPPTVALTAATDDVGAVTGALVSGGRTDDTALLLSGTNEAGAVVKVYNGAIFLGSATVSGTTWSYAATVADGTTYQFNATATDVAGNTSAATANFTVIGDTTPPAIALTAATDDVGAVTGALLSGATTDDTALLLSGTNEAGAVVNVYNGATLLGSATVTGTTWSYTATVADGTTYQFNAKATDAAGNTSAATANFTVIGDTTPPAVALTAATDDVGAVTGALLNGASTDDTALLLSGTNEAGAVVKVYNGVTLLGSATVTGTTWSYTATVADGATYQFNAKATDAAGNTSAATANFTVIGDTAPPAVALTAGTDDVGSVLGALVSGATTDDTALLLSGTNEAGAVVKVYNGATLLGSATVTGTTWSYTATVADGTTYQFNAKATDAAGNTSAATANFTVIGDTTPPAVALTAATDDVGSVLGALVSGARTDDTALLLSGTNEAGAVVKVYNGATLLGSATVTGMTWSYTATVADGATYQFNATATDAAGNTSAATANFTVIGDTTPPAVALTAATDDVGSVVGALVSGARTDDTALLLSGTNEAGAVVKVYNGATLLGNATVTGTTWSYSATVADATTYQFNAKATDVAGNTSAATADFTVIGDTTAPTATAAVTRAEDNVGIVQGNVTSGSTTDDSTLVLAGTFSGALAADDVIGVYDGATRLGSAAVAVNGGAWTYTTANLSNAVHSFTARVEDVAGNKGAAGTAYVVTVAAGPSIDSVTDNVGSVTGPLQSGDHTDDSTLLLSGTNEPGVTVKVYDGVAFLGDAVVTSTTWSYTATVLDGVTYQFNVKATDASNNVSVASSNFTVIGDMTPPGAPVIDAVATNDIVNAAEQTAAITGTTEANATINLTLGANTRTVTANNAGVWSYTLTAADITAMGQGDETLSATATDTAGNPGAAETRNISVDTGVPVAPVIALATDSGLSVGDGITNIGTVNVTGLEVGATWQYSTNSGTSFVTGTGTSFTLPAGPYAVNAVQVRQLDIAGNTSPVGSNAGAITIDSTAPLAPTINAVATDNIVNATEQTAAITGTAEANATVVLSLGGNARTVTANGSGAWSYTLTPADITAMGEGAEMLSARATDAAGNISAAGTRAISVDTTLPTLLTAAVLDTTLTLTYSEALDAAYQPSASYFQVSPSGTAAGRVIQTVQVFDNTVTLTFGSSFLPASSGTTYTLKYSDPSAGNDAYSVQDLAGNDAASYAAQAITVNASGGTDTTAPSIVGATLTPGTLNASVTLQFSEAVAFTNATGLTLTSSAGASIPFTLASGATTDTLVLTTTTTLAATNSVVVGYNSATGTIKDAAATPNSLASITILVGGDSANTISAATSISGVMIRANGGGDTVTGSNSSDNIIAGGGIDSIEGGNGADTINLNEGTRAVDTVKLLSTNTSWIPGYDTVYAFDVSNAAGTNNDVLNLPSGTIAADAGMTAGTAVNTIAKHSIASGIVSFYDASNVAVAITSTNKADALNYLSSNLTQAGRTVGFALDSDGNGQSDSLMVFQDGVAINGYGNSDIAVQLAGVNGVTLSNTAGQNVVQIADTTAATSVVRSFATGANSVLTQIQSEDVSATGTGTAATILVNGAGIDVLAAHTESGNTVTFTTIATLAQTDWLLFTSGSATADGAGNASTAGNLALVGGSDANVIDGSGVNVTAVTGSSTVNISTYGGNDQITGTAAADVISGGAGADIVSGGSGADQFRFIQGDSTAVTVAVGGDSTLNTGDIFTFAGGVADVVHGRFDVAGTDAGSGDRIQLRSLANQSNPTSMTAPTNGLVTDQKFYVVQGNYDAEANAFDVSTTLGLDTLVVYDGDATAAVSQTALVVQGHAPTTLTISGNTLYANVADTDGTAPTLNSAVVNGITLSMNFSEAIDPEHTPLSSSFPVVLVNGIANAVVNGSIAGNVVTLTLQTAVISSDVVTFSYTDPTSGNDANALQDLAGNDVASGSNIPVTYVTLPTLNANALNDVTNLEVSSDIVLNFSANVSAAAAKYIHIINDGGTGFHGESTVNTLDILVTDTSQVTIVGGKVTINPTADLDLANNYHITIDAGAFTDSASGAAMAAYDGTTTLNFSTVTPGATALANAAASQVMSADGTLASGHLWLDIEGIGSPSASAGTALDLSANSYALVAKDYDAAGGSPGNDGVKTGNFYVAANNFGAGDVIYIDNQGGAANDLTQTNVIDDGTPPTTVQFAGTELGGLLDISIAGSTATFDTIAQLKVLLGSTTSPVISA